MIRILTFGARFAALASEFIMMTFVQDKPRAEKAQDAKPQAAAKRRRSRWRTFGLIMLFVLGLLIAARLAMPSFARWYVNRTIDRNPLYDGRIGDVHIHLYRGAYSIDDIRLNKVTGNLPVPLFAAKRLDIAKSIENSEHVSLL